MRRLAFSAAVLALLATGCSNSGSRGESAPNPDGAPDEMQVLHGELSLFEEAEIFGAGCERYASSEGYEDIRTGSVVTVRDQSDEVIGVGELGEPRGVETSREQAYYDESITIVQGYCVYPFSVEVPTEPTFYSIEVAQRGALPFSKEQLEADDWTVEVSLGP